MDDMTPDQVRAELNRVREFDQLTSLIEYRRQHGDWPDGFKVLPKAARDAAIKRMDELHLWGGTTTARGLY